MMAFAFPEKDADAIEDDFEVERKQKKKVKKPKENLPISIFFLKFVERGFLALVSVLLLYAWVCFFSNIHEEHSFFLKFFFTNTMQYYLMCSTDNDKYISK
jgi:hypothetical protein